MGYGAGKVILLGEHAVVYGQPALAVALDRGATASFQAGEASAPSVRLSFAPEAPPYTSPALHQAISAIAKTLGAPQGELALTLHIPPSRGLGSSAALCVAAARALLAAMEKQEADTRVEEAAGAGEAVFHGRPSGIDAAVSLRGKALLFRLVPSLDSPAEGREGPLPSPVGSFSPPRASQSDPDTKPLLEPVLAKTPFSLILADTGARAPTRTLVEKIRAAREADPARLMALFSEIGRLVERGAEALREGDLAALGAVMNRNQEILATLGLSTPLLEEGIRAAREAGAWGAKLTGAGGGGCLVAVSLPEDKDRIRQSLSQAGCLPVEAELDPALFLQAGGA